MECGKDRTGRDTFDSVGVWVSVWVVRRGVEGARTHYFKKPFRIFV